MTRGDARCNAERLRAAVSRFRGDDGAPLTMSFGVVEFPRNGQSRQTLVYAADRALNEAKALGRNRGIVQRGDSGEGARRFAEPDRHRLRRSPVGQRIARAR